MIPFIYNYNKVPCMHASILLSGTIISIKSSLYAVAAPGGFLRFLETGQPSHQARQLTILSKAAGVVTATGMRMNLCAHTRARS